MSTLVSSALVVVPSPSHAPSVYGSIGRRIRSGYWKDSRERDVVIVFAANG